VAPGGLRSVLVEQVAVLQQGVRQARALQVRQACA